LNGSTSSRGTPLRLRALVLRALRQNSLAISNSKNINKNFAKKKLELYAREEFEPPKATF